PEPVSNPTDVTWNQEQKGLRTFIEAEKDLNTQRDVPLGLTICVYQLKEYVAFQKLAATPSGIRSLLDCTLDTTGALSARSYAVQPGQHLEISHDRMENARFLAVVAGFAHLKPEMCVAVQAFPLHKERQGLLRHTVYSATPIDVRIRLGAASISLTGVERVR
ncbi:MAG: type VI secretion lipoprotein TssJ, partial [Bilophila sp.]